MALDDQTDTDSVLWSVKIRRSTASARLHLTKIRRVTHSKIMHVN